MLIEAVSSATSQEIDQQVVEIIVIKTYVDVDLDLLLLKKNIKSIKLSKGPLGEKVSAGIASARGEIISFLEDDDLFSVSKATKMLELFSKFENLVYCHNSFLEIDIKSKPIETNKLKQIKSDKLIHSPVNEASQLKGLLKFQPASGLSSISIRKSNLIDYLEVIKEFNFLTDSAIFFLSSLKGGDFYLSSEILTYYRIHNSLKVFTNKCKSKLRIDNFDNSTLKKSS